MPGEKCTRFIYYCTKVNSRPAYSILKFLCKGLEIEIGRNFCYLHYIQDTLKIIRYVLFAAKMYIGKTEKVVLNTIWNVFFYKSEKI